MLISSSPVSTGRLPAAERVRDLVAEAHERLKSTDEGKNADYIRMIQARHSAWPTRALPLRDERRSHSGSRPYGFSSQRTKTIRANGSYRLSYFAVLCQIVSLSSLVLFLCGHFA